MWPASSVHANNEWRAGRDMKSLINKWAKKTKAKGKGSAGGSENGSRETSSESARIGQKKAVNGSPATNIYPGMEAKDFGKVRGMLLHRALASPVRCRAQLRLQCDALGCKTFAEELVCPLHQSVVVSGATYLPFPVQFSDDSAFRDSNSGNRANGHSSSTAGGTSTSSSHFSSSIEGKPSMDSVLRPQTKQGTPPALQTLLHQADAIDKNGWSI